MKNFQKIRLTLVFDGKETVFGAEDLGMGTDADQVLQDAFGYNKNEEDSLAVRF